MSSPSHMPALRRAGGLPHAFLLPDTYNHSSALTSSMDEISSEGSSLEGRREASCSSVATGR